MILVKLILDIIVLCSLLWIFYILKKKKQHQKYLLIPLVLFQVLSITLDASLLLSGFQINFSELILIESFFMIGKTVSLLILYSQLFKHFRPVYFSVLYLITVTMSRIGFTDFMILINTITYLLLLLVFIYAHRSKHKYFRRAGFFGILFATLSLMLMAFNFTFYAEAFFLTYPLLIISYYYLGEYVQTSGKIFGDPGRYHVVWYYKLMMISRILAASAIITLFVVITTISVHEVGHALAAEYFGCRFHKAIIYDGQSMPHTEVICDTQENDVYIASAGILLPLFLGMLLLLTGERSVIGISYLIFGFSFYFSSRDIEYLTFSKSIVALLGILSLMFLTLGIKEVISFLYDDENFKSPLL